MSIQGFDRAARSSRVAARLTGGSAAAVTLDESQRAVLALADDASRSVIGAPGSGKTTTLIELVADRVLGRGWSADEVMVLTQGRAPATRLRDQLALRLGIPTNGPLARTVNSLAFEIVGGAARAAGAPTPRLVTGGEQDADIAGLLDGHLEEGGGPDWPEALGPEVRRLRGFRTELRELMMRATEFDISPARLRELAGAQGRPEWAAAAEFIEEYLAVVTAYRSAQLDAAELSRFAIEAIHAGSAGERVARTRLVVVDDLQEATQSTIELLRALAARGIAVVGFGDPDVAANAFRGGQPAIVAALGGLLGGAPEPLVLSTVYRHGPAIRELVGAAVERIGVAGAVGQRRARAVGDDAPTPLRRLHALTPGRQTAALARHLRELHLIHGVPWSDIAVVVRSSAAAPGLRRALALAEVPARTTVGSTPMREDRAARALLTVVDVGIGRAPLSAETATELLLGPFGGLDRLALRRLRLALRAEEIVGGGTRSADELLVEALAAPGRFATIDHRSGRRADRLARILHDLGELHHDSGTIEELLWLAWDRSGLASEWFDQALSAGITAAEANSNLDGVMALFTAAKRFVERRPGVDATVFLGDVLDADVPEDTLSPQPSDDAVLVTTPSGAVGLDFHTVVIAGLQEGAWPNTRLRNSLLRAGELVDAIRGIDANATDARKQVLDDELRIFALAVSRAREQVILSAVANEDESASVLFSLLPEGTPPLDAGSLPPLSLRGLTGRLRRDLADDSRPAADRRAAAAALARLAAERVPGADPVDWHGLIPVSTEAPLYAQEERVPVSPSQLEKFENSPLDWFIDSMAGGESTVAMGLGTILHWAMETATDSSVDAIWSAVESRWGELLFESPWMAEAQKRAARVLAAGIAEYLADFARDGKQLVAAERRFTLEVDRAEVRGSIDRIERSPDGAIVIVDLKTGTPPAAAKVAGHAQLGAYQLAYAEGVLDEYLAELGDHHAGGAKLLFVKQGERSKLYKEQTQAPLTPAELEGFRVRIRQAAAGMALASYQGSVEYTGWGATASGAPALHRVRAVSSD
ncbi:PD-(D/E)XK nuclease family protein [Galbitalea soli]|uniref:DNA 3'-5' helicase n=1 Tax=Galbitalea soli TaxID=1268042 RepID=A0A7C9PM89_9MICO|nr:ATP-dependent helicase [Galbitalea soli]NYJ31307.1 superfamily I DNA/RNA helicase/RecB family exonuclease [Galbitalea soli]